MPGVLDAVSRLRSDCLMASWDEATKGSHSAQRCTNLCTNYCRGGECYCLSGFAGVEAGMEAGIAAAPAVPTINRRCKRKRRELLEASAGQVMS